MPRKIKPGPRSKTKSPHKAVHRFLGESSTEISSDENQSFASAELEDQTDYGLEFTTSKIPTGARDQPSTSTARTRGFVYRSSNREEMSGPESEDVSRSPSPQVRQTRSSLTAQNTSSQTQTRSSSRAPNSSSQAPTTSGSRAQNSSAQKQNPQPTPSRSANNEGHPQGRKKPRKQRTPLQREKRFWATVRKLQNRTDNLIPKASFCRVIREILIQCSTTAHRITVTALEALQVTSEMYLTYLFQDAYCCTIHRDRVTLTRKDIELTRYLRGERFV